MTEAIGNWRVFSDLDYAEEIRGNSWVELQDNGDLRIRIAGMCQGEDGQIDLPAAVFERVIAKLYARREGQ